MYVSRKMDPSEATELCHANGVMNSQTSRSVSSSPEKCDDVVVDADDNPGAVLPLPLPPLWWFGEDDGVVVDGSNETSVEVVVLNVIVLNVESRVCRPTFLLAEDGEDGAALLDWNIFLLGGSWTCVCFVCFLLVCWEEIGSDREFLFFPIW